MASSTLTLNVQPPIEHTEFRAYTAYPGTQYILPSDEQEKLRLQLQHRVIATTHDGKILVAPADLKEGDKVLDSGTGSGIWLLDFAKDFPKTVSFHGVDIEGRLFPKPTELAENVQFERQSVLSLPTEWSSTFALINQRLLIVALKRTEWNIALRELYRVLAPGGWLQLLEPGTWTAGPAGRTHKTLFSAVANARGLLPDITKRLPGMLTEVGFVNIQVQDRTAPLGKWAGIHGEEGRENLLGVWKGMKTPILNMGGFGVVESEMEFDKLMDDVEREYDDTPGSEIHWVFTYAQKPYDS